MGAFMASGGVNGGEHSQTHALYANRGAAPRIARSEYQMP